VWYVLKGMKRDCGLLEDAIAPGEADEKCEKLQSGQQVTQKPGNSQSICITVYHRDIKIIIDAYISLSYTWNAYYMYSFQLLLVIDG
jgi:hypothetical protein